MHFLLISCFLFAFLSTLTASASLPHTDISFFLCCFKLSLRFLHSPCIPWILFSSLSMHSALLLSEFLYSFLFLLLVLCMQGVFAAWCISSITFSLPYLFIPKPVQYIVEEWKECPGHRQDPEAEGNASLLICRSHVNAGFAANIDPIWGK